MWLLLREKLIESLKAILPLVAVICVLQVTVIRAPLPLFLQFLTGSALAALGMMLLFIGIELGILPMGRFVGAELSRRGSLALLVAVGVALGFAITVAEPDVLILANQVDAVSRRAISGTAVLYAVAAGVGAFTAIALVRIVFGWPMKYLLAAAYTLILALAFATPHSFVSLAFDAGSVTTGVLSAPVVIALAVGISAVLAGRSAVADGFGILGFASVGPIVAVMVMGILAS
jgi:hypothetical protein